MKIESKIYLLIASMIILLSLYLYQQKVEKEYQKELKRYELFQQNASKFISLKKSRENSQRVLNHILKIFNPSLHSKKANFHKIVFKDLNKKEFSRLMGILINSTIYIKKIDIKKIKNKIVLGLEVGL